MSSMAPAVECCIKIITYLSEQTAPVGISNISAQTDINKNMVSRILHTLKEGDWVKCDEKSCYSLTLLPFKIASRVVEHTSLVNDAVLFLRNFWKKYGESTYLGILHDDQVLYLLHMDSVQPVKVAGVVGGSYPLYCTAPGKVLLAYCDEKTVSEYIETHTLKKCTENTLITKEKLLQELAQIRRMGYALDREEFGRGIVCIAAPVFGCRGEVLGTVGCSLSTLSCSSDEIYDYCGKDLVLCAKEISAAMGYASEKGEN